MSRKLCLNCQTRPASNDTAEGLFCNVCDELAGYENQHSDWGHDEVAAGDTGDWKIALIQTVEADMRSCWVCHPEFVPALPKPRTGHTNTAAKSYTSHANCDHATTPKAREICRRARRA